MAFNFTNGIMNSFIKMSDAEYEDEEYDDSDFEEEEEETNKSRRGFFRKNTAVEEDDEDLYTASAPASSTPAPTSTPGTSRISQSTASESSRSTRRRGNSNVVNFRSSTAETGEISMIKPKNPDQDGMLAIDELKMGKTVILNLDGMDSKQAQHILDYVSGASYCMGCNFGTIASNVYVFSPITVQLTGDFPSGAAKETTDSFSSYSKSRYTNKYEY